MHSCLCPTSLNILTLQPLFLFPMFLCFSIHFYSRLPRVFVLSYCSFTLLNCFLIKVPYLIYFLGFNFPIVLYCCFLFLFSYFSLFSLWFFFFFSWKHHSKSQKSQNIDNLCFWVFLHFPILVQYHLYSLNHFYWPFLIIFLSYPSVSFFPCCLNFPGFWSH